MNTAEGIKLSEDPREDKIRKAAILARMNTNLDIDVIKLATYYGDKMKKLDISDRKKEADELEKEWKAMFKGFVIKNLMHTDLTDDEVKDAVKYLKL